MMFATTWQWYGEVAQVSKTGLDRSVQRKLFPAGALINMAKGKSHRASAYDILINVALW